jgi:hypothetical protein
LRKLISLLLIALFSPALSLAQSPVVETSAAKSVQQTQPTSDTPKAPDTLDVQPERRELKIPAGTALEIEAANTVRSVDMRPNDFLSFRVLVPVKVDGVTLIERDALVTGRVVESKRGGRWGKAGKLSWIMLDVVAVDLSRVPVQPHQELPGGGERIRGISHGGEVAAKTIMLSVFWPLAPMAVISGAFKRGEDAILPEGKRFIVYVPKETKVSVTVER